MKKSRLALILLITILFSLAPLTGETRESAEGLYKEGLEFMKQENLNKALESFDRSIEIDPLGNPEAYFYRAKVYESLGKYEDAVFDYLKSCELGSVHCAEVMPDKLVDLQKVPRSKWEVGDFGYHVDSQGENTYGPLNAVDGFSRTAWVTRDDPSSILEDMMIGFKSLADATVSEFTIRSGYCKSMDIWEKNSRVKSVAVIINGKPVGVFKLKDIVDEQTFSLGKDYSLKADDIISFLIIETYPGSKYTDVAISELRLANDIETVLNDTETISLPMTLYPYSPMGYGNPGRTNTYDEEGVQVFHRLKWKFKTGDWNVSTPCVTGGVAYFGSSNGNFYAVEAETGKELWRFKTEYSVNHSPCVDDNVVYFGSGDNNLYAVDAKTGQELWRFKTGGWLASNPCVVDGVVYFGSDDGNLYAVDAKTGQELWRFETGGRAGSSPCVVDGVVYFESDDGNLYSVDAKSGQELWRFTSKGDYIGNPRVIGGVVYFKDGYEKIYGVDAKTGQELWNFKWNGCIGAWCPSGGVIYFSSSKFDPDCFEEDIVYAVDIKSGIELWQRSYWIGTSLCVVAGVVYFAIHGDTLCTLDAETGRELWRFKGEGGSWESVVEPLSNPCVVDGVVYFGSWDGYLYALE